MREVRLGKWELPGGWGQRFYFNALLSMFVHDGIGHEFVLELIRLRIFSGCNLAHVWLVFENKAGDCILTGESYKEASNWL